MSLSLFDLPADQGLDHFTLDFIYAAFDGHAQVKLLRAWFIVCCLLAGLAAQVTATGETSHDNPADGCCQTHEITQHSQSHHDGDQCPVEHHHLGCCTHTFPSAVENDLSLRLGAQRSSLLGVNRHQEVAPEGPFLSAEKPPLI
jgi:hypothetical protein